MQKQK